MVKPADRFSGLVPFSHPIRMCAGEPIRQLWHVPVVPAGTCPGCRELVTEGGLEYRGQSYHSRCFLCSKCADVLTDQVVAVDDLILHPTCYEELFGHRCVNCTGTVRKDRGVSCDGKYYHSACFTCIACSTPLDPEVAGSFKSVGGAPICKTCLGDVKVVTPVCAGCATPVLSHHKKLDFFFHGQRLWVHDPGCAKCRFCGDQTRRDFVYANQSLCCQTCYETGVRRPCATCHQPIFGVSIDFAGQHWHPRHFVCNYQQCPREDHVISNPEDAVFDQGNLRHVECFNAAESRCTFCHTPLKSDCVVACGRTWHSQCLICQICHQPVLRRRFVSFRGAPVCEKCVLSQQYHDRFDKKGRVTREGYQKFHDEEIQRRSRAQGQGDLTVDEVARPHKIASGVSVPALPISTSGHMPSAMTLDGEFAQGDVVL